MEKPLAAANAGEGGCSGGTAFSRASSQRGGTRPGALILGMVRKLLLPGAVPAARLALGLGRGKDPCWKLVCSQRLLLLTSGVQGWRWVLPELGVDPQQTGTCLSGHLVALWLFVRMLDARGLFLQLRALLPLSLSALDWLVQRAESKAAFPHHPRALLGMDGAGVGAGWEEPGLR